METDTFNPPKTPILLNFENGAVNSRATCWTCGTDESKEKLDYHHMIPRALGGEAGPMVGLCQPCHRRVHELGSGDQDALPKTSNAITLQRLFILSNIIIEAANRTKNNPNKSVMFSARFPARIRRKLQRLAKISKRSQRTVVETAIEDLYAKVFGSTEAPVKPIVNKR